MLNTVSLILSKLFIIIINSLNIKNAKKQDLLKSKINRYTNISKLPVN